MALLLAKLVIAPSFVAAVSVLGRRFGPALAGFLASLPVVGGPILGLLIAEQGLAFGERAALASALGAAPTMVFALAYAHAAQRLSWQAAILAAYGAYGVSAAALLSVPPSWASAVAVPLATWALTLRLFPRREPSNAARAPSRWDLPVRMGATVALVLLITTIARAIGPERSGLLTPFPIATAVLAVFAHRDVSASSAAVLLRALVRGLLSFTAFFLFLAVALVRLGAFTSFVLAAFVALLVHATLTLRAVSPSETAA